MSRGDFDGELKACKRKSITYWTAPDPAAQAGEGIVATRFGPAADDLLMPMSFLQSLPPPDMARDVELAKKARSDFAAARRTDGTRPQSLFRYAECELLEQGEPTAHTADVLVTACNLAPQVDVIALVTAQVLMARDRFKEAELVLRPLLGELHAGERPRIAQQLVALAKAEILPPFLFYGSAAGDMFPD